jgi:small neutral amino acid transporter SnatA (MarC family)
MAEEKMNCNCGHGHGGKKFMLFGVLAIVYGVINYLMNAMGWETHTAWFAGGAILLLISWAKGGR